MPKALTTNAQDHDPAASGAGVAPDLSVVIVSYNTREVTLQAVGSVLRHMGDLSVEVIVIDNASDDGSVEALRAAYPQISAISAGYNGGYAWGNNLGIARARGRYVLVLNPDIVMRPDTLPGAITYMDAHPEVGILGARVFLENDVQQSSLFRHLSLRHIAWNILIPNRIIRNSRLFGDQRYASRPRDRVLDVDVVAGCFMLVPRRVIGEAGPMDERFFMYSEESEWCWRIARAGYAIRYHPDIEITHFGAVSTGQTSPWKSVEIAKGQILFLRFTRGPGAARIATALMLVGDLLRGLWFLPQMLTMRGRARGAAWRARAAFLLRALMRQPQGQNPPRTEVLGA